MVRMKGLEPSLREELEPKSSASTNFATSANHKAAPQGRLNARLLAKHCAEREGKNCLWIKCYPAALSCPKLIKKDDRGRLQVPNVKHDTWAK